MTNLYELLAAVLANYDKPSTGFDPNNCAPGQLVHITPDVAEFIRNYLKAPEVLINFKARKVGEQADGEPIMAQDFQIAGEGFEVFCLITEAMVHNYQFAETIQKAVAFYREHIPTCPICAPKHFGAIAPAQNWIFSHVKPEKDGK